MNFKKLILSVTLACAAVSAHAGYRFNTGYDNTNLNTGTPQFQCPAAMQAVNELEHYGTAYAARNAVMQNLEPGSERDAYLALLRWLVEYPDFAHQNVHIINLRITMECNAGKLEWHLEHPDKLPGVTYYSPF